MIYERLSDGQDDLKKVSREHLELFGSSGLRTLCLAYKDLSPDMYESWNEKFIQAKSTLRDREKKLDEVSFFDTKSFPFSGFSLDCISYLVLFFTLNCSSALFTLKSSKIVYHIMQVNLIFNEGGGTH